MTSPRHANAVENLEDILRKDVDGRVFSSHVEKDYPREFEFGPSDEIWGDIDLMMESDDVAYIYEVKTALDSIRKGFRQIHKAEEFLKDHGYAVNSKIVLTDDRYQGFEQALQNLDWYFDKEEMKDRWDNHQHTYIHLNGANVIKEIDSLESFKEPIEPGKYPLFDYQRLEKMGFLKRNGSGFHTTSKFDRLNRSIEREERTVYHLTPRNDQLQYFDIDDYEE